jgi:membrane protease YdiL (CAAX protease family)
VLDVPPLGLWRVPWRAPTVALVMLLWSVAYVLAGRGLNSALLASGLQLPGAAMGDRALALYSFTLDALECLATALVLRGSLAFYGPLPPGWFALNVRGAAQQWRLLLAACATFPLLSSLTALAYDALRGAAAPAFWEGASLAALHAGSCDCFALCTYVASYVLLAPLWEEAVFRGFLLLSLCRFAAAHEAVCLSALLFAAAHGSAAIPGLLLLGVLLGGVYVRTRSLAAPILLHALWNLYVIGGMLLA